MNCACGKPEWRGGQCLSCWRRAFGQSRRIYRWTPELHEILRAAYRGRKKDLAAALDRLQHMTGWPRSALKSEARSLGLRPTFQHHPWTPEQIEYLNERLGSDTADEIARQLGRSCESVESMAAKLSLSCRVREGYTESDLIDVLGETSRKVRRWMDRGLLGPVERINGHRVSDRCVAIFLRRHHSEYDLRRVDQDWYKAMLFGHLSER